MTKTVEDLVEAEVSTDVDDNAIAALRTGLNGALETSLAGWDRPSDKLRITKDRLRRGRTCPAQLLGGGSLPMNEYFSLGRVVDAAASAIAVAPDTPHERNKDGPSVTGTWRHAIAAPLRGGDPELEEWYSALSPAEQLEHDELIEARCDELKSSMGDLRSFTLISQDSMIVDLAADVVLSARPDLVVLAAGRNIVEVKSGSAFGIDDELAFYALVDTLRTGAAPAVAAAVTLLPSATVRSIQVDADLLHRAAHRVVEAARWCREVDESVAAKRWPRTSSGPHCEFCDLAERCPDIPDELLEGARQRTGHEIDDDIEPLHEEEPW